MTYVKGTAPGRPEGAQNKLTLQAREAFQMAFDAVGGVERLSAWAGENLEAFYKIYSKLIPVSLDVDIRVTPKAVVRPIQPPTIDHITTKEIEDEPRTIQ